ISLAQTAEGALGKVGDMLQRVRELAVQSSNATNSASDRTALQAEVTQLVSEIDRVAKTTSFNGTKILDGSFAGGVFQVGANAGDNITVGGIGNAKAADLATVSYFSTTVATGTVAATNVAITTGLTVNGVDIGGLDAATSAQERTGQVVAAINAKTADTGVTAFVENGNF
ncbi:MAG: flagellin hook IN motif-containing protein, partial [Comamonas sp.]